MHSYSLFGALDGQDFVAAGEHWRVEVFSVVEEATHVWIQLRLVGRLSRLLTLCLSRKADVREALEAVTTWLDGRPASHCISNVA
jgi:hypothetical protein